MPKASPDKGQIAPMVTVQESSASKILIGVKIVGAVLGVLGTLLFFLIAGIAVLGIFGTSDGSSLGGGNIAIIPVKGVITTQQAGDYFMTDGAVSDSIVKYIDEAAKDEDIKAIILDIDSPGGSPVASAEIAEALQRANKTTVAVVRELGASGAYWVASATNKIYAHRLSWVGSIGVTGSYVEYAGLLTRFNMTYRRLVGGKYKDTGSPERELTTEEQVLIQQQIDKLHNIFIDTVAKNRKLPREKVQELATGWVYLGDEALSYGLVDKLGNMDDAVQDLEAQLKITAETVEYANTPTLLDILGRVSASGLHAVGEGIGSSLVKQPMGKVELR